MIDKIVEMIKVEAEHVRNPNPCSRLFNVMQRVDRRIVDIMDEILEKERRVKRDENKG